MGAAFGARFARKPTRRPLRLPVPGGVLVALGLLAGLLLVGSLVDERFTARNNLLNVFEQSTGLALVALGQCLVIMVGGIDLSIGALTGLAAVLLSGVVAGDDALVLPVMLGVVALSALLGALNGLGTVGLRVHSLIVTLGMAAVLQGVALLYSLAPAGSMPPWFDSVAYGRFAGVPVAAGATVLLYAAAAYWMHAGVGGRRLLAVGGDARAARLVGVPVARVTVAAFAMSGAMTGLAAIYLVSRFGVGGPYTGADFTLASITPVILGGTRLGGGRGSLVGTLLGVYVLTLTNNVLNFLDLSSDFQYIVQGLVLIAAVAAVRPR